MGTALFFILGLISTPVCITTSSVVYICVDLCKKILICKHSKYSFLGTSHVLDALNFFSFWTKQRVNLLLPTN